MEDDFYAVGAKFYDGAYQNNPNLKDIPFYVDLARQFGGPVLELGCGTGRVLLEIARAGIEICGVDNSKEQLSILTSKLTKEMGEVRNRVSTFTRDMRSLTLGRKFPLVIIPFRPMQHMYTVDDQIAALTSARNHLTPDGILAFDVFHPDYTLLLEPLGKEVLELEWQVPEKPGLTVRRYFKRTAVHFLQQLFEAEFVFRTFDGERLVAEERAPFRMSYYTYPQLLLLFRVCGLQIVEQYGSFAKDPIEVRKEMIFLLRRA